MIFDNIYKTDINFNKRVIREPVFKHIAPDNLNIYDIVLAYNDGKVWKIIPINVLNKYPIIYDKYFEKYRKSEDKFKYNISNITVSYCPYTSCGLIYFDKFVPTGETYNNNIILAPDDKYIMAQMIGKMFQRKTKTEIPTIIRRNETKIMLFRNAVSKYPDCMFLHFDKDIEPLVSNNYGINKKIHHKIQNKSNMYHSKTLVYGIEYKSQKSNYDNKYTVIVSKDASKNKINSRDINMYSLYFAKMIEKIRNKNGIVIPVYWYAWYGMFPKTKVIKL